MPALELRLCCQTNKLNRIRNILSFALFWNRLLKDWNYYSLNVWYNLLNKLRFLHGNIWNYWFQVLKNIIPFRIVYNVFWSNSSQVFPDPPPFQSTQLYVSISSKNKIEYEEQCLLPKYSWMCGLPLECGWLTRGNILRQNWLFLSQHLTTASSFTSRDRILYTNPLCILGFSPTWTFIDLVCAVQFLRVHMRSYCFQKTLPHCSHPRPLVLNTLFTPSSIIIPGPSGEGLYVPFRDEYSTVSYFLCC